MPNLCPTRDRDPYHYPTLGNEAPLSLGVILRQLDGGSEAPGRMMIM